jgi:L-2-hydroxyglutarate oxidase LhgO
MVYPLLMTAAAKSPESKDARAERLAAALRENLKRRKAQARAQERVKDAEKEEP